MPDGSDTPQPKRSRVGSKIGPRKLSPIRARFVDEFVKEPVGAKAARKAGYKPDNAKVTASRLLTNGNVKAEIEYGLARVARKQEISAERVVQRLAHLSDRAEDAGQFGAAAQCEVALGKHLDLFTEKSLHLHVDASGAHLAALLALAERRKTKTIEHDDSDLS